MKVAALIIATEIYSMTGVPEESESAYTARRSNMKADQECNCLTAATVDRSCARGVT